MESIWSEGITLPRFGRLEGSRKTDVLIIGGGLAGILCAWFLQKKGVDYILLEGGRICGGETGNTTAKITYQHGLLYNRILKQAGPERAKLYLEANKNALLKYTELCKRIDCDFETKTAYVYSVNNRRKLEKEADALEKIGFRADITGTGELPFPTAGAIAFRNQAQFHPLKFVSHIARGLKIYEHSFVKELSQDTAVAGQGSVSFKKLIFATHFPIDNKHGMYFMKMYQHRSYAIALEQAARINGMYVEEGTGGMSFRQYGDFLLLGGGGHRTGKRGGNWQELREFAEKYYPSSRERTCWAAQDCMTLDGIPYIGQYSRAMPNCFVAAGFNKWGMTGAMTAAMVLSDLVMGRANPYAEVFNPSRSMYKKQLLLNGCEAVGNLLTLSGKRCPHLGCALKWNSIQHSWDCPCHGSRFAGDGRLLDNPANGNLKI